MENKERKIDFLKKMMALAEEEVEDCSYGEKELRMGARVGCDCGCGGEFLTDEDFEHERDESKYEVLFNLSDGLKEMMYFYRGCQEEIEKYPEEYREGMEIILEKYDEDIDKAMEFAMYGS